MTVFNINPLCIGCQKHPSQIEEYNDPEVIGTLTPEEYVQQEEGTYNPKNGHFLCTECYIEAGMPSREWPDRWIAP